MQSRTPGFLRALLALSFVAFCFGENLFPKNLSESETALLESAALVFEGSKYAVLRGDLYRFDSAGKRWIFSNKLYDPNFFEMNYVREDGRVFRLDPNSGKRFEMKKEFSSGFEDVPDLKSLTGEKTGWTSFVLRSPRAPSVADYVKLRKSLLECRGDFLDNRVAPSRERAYSGESSLRVSSVPPSPTMVCSKAHLETEMLHFTQGDDYWFSAWYFLESGMPYTIADIKSSWIYMCPGMRVTLDDEEPQFELKWADKPRCRQLTRPGRKLPRGRWTHLKVHLKLSAKNDGLNELWLDGEKIVESRSRNLPVPEAVYNHLEVGITATSKDAVLFVDDVRVSASPL